MSAPKKLTQKAKAIELLAQGYSNAETCRQAGIHEATIYRWLHEPEFCDAVKRATDDIIRGLRARVVKRFADILGSSNEFAALQAGQAILGRNDKIDGADTHISVTITGAPQLGTPPESDA